MLSRMYDSQELSYTEIVINFHLNGFQCPSEVITSHSQKKLSQYVVNICCPAQSLPQKAHFRACGYRREVPISRLSVARGKPRDGATTTGGRRSTISRLPLPSESKKGVSQGDLSLEVCCSLLRDIEIHSNGNYEQFPYTTIRRIGDVRDPDRNILDSASVGRPSRKHCLPFQLLR
jgi:hypothetical protein